MNHLGDGYLNPYWSKLVFIPNQYALLRVLLLFTFPVIALVAYRFLLINIAYDTKWFNLVITMLILSGYCFFNGVVQGSPGIFLAGGTLL
jgi:hypothetical protein